MRDLEIEKRFGFHKARIEGPNPQEETHKEVREKFKVFASYLDSVTDGGRYKDLAMDTLEQAAMWFHKSIAIEPKDSEGK